ncbi:cilia- and flagella-associated protein 44 [Platichthys flesus]|uniref:cilia- and flagella-associated protein 44 n=1 Tax=Platichthys flesus TaxID=8260 RepID=UPI002DB578EA|nr:cilia- and flagella-associated protein 44 [Platichthys flesus]
MEYDYEALHSRPTITADSDIPENLLHLCHSFGYESGRNANLQLLDETTLMFIAGNLLVLLDLSTKEQRYLRSCSGGGIGAITVHPSRQYFVAAEKGTQPSIIIYEYPSLRLYRILRGGTEQAYSFVEFNRDGSLLASVGSFPDFMLTLWNWRDEEVMLSCKAISQEVYRVSFSRFNPELLTSSGSGHIKFWKMASTFTGLKLQGLVGRFGKTASTDIEGYVELPDGKVVSGTDWGNLLLWDGNTIKVEICRKNGQSCHIGTVQPFVLEEGQLLTIGSDGMVRGWDFETIDSADSSMDSSRFEMEPLNELEVGNNVCLSSAVKSPQPDSFVWFAQDSCGAIWKLDLSFTHTAPDPECLFSFHAGAIQGLDVSPNSHLMATISLDRSVRVFDFLSNRELTISRFFQGGTALLWAPPEVSQAGGLLVTGFEDGVVRLLELFDPQRLPADARRQHKGDARLNLKQAFKPHNAPVTAVAYDRNGDVLATGSSDSTVFFFTVGDSYRPIGWVHVPGPVLGLQWSPHSHEENRLLVLCENGHVVELHCPDPRAQKPSKSFELPELPRRSFRFRSIKSRIKREAEKARRQAEKEKKKADLFKESKLGGVEEEEEEEEEEDLPPIFIPDPPSPLYCGFYSQPGCFWLSMGGFDSGFLYHCRFSEDQGEDLDPQQDEDLDPQQDEDLDPQQDEDLDPLQDEDLDPLQDEDLDPQQDEDLDPQQDEDLDPQQDEDLDPQQDEPFDFVPVCDTDDDPVRSVTFSSDRKLLLCGLHSGTIRVYLLQDQGLSSMRDYWALSVHDNQNGQLRHIRCSHDDNFVLTAGEDGNIFSFSLLPPEELQTSLQKKKATVPSPRVGVEKELYAQDIEGPTADSIVTAKLKLEKDRLQREAELKITEKKRKLAELQKKFKQVLKVNRSLPEHVRLKPEELELHPCFKEEAERLKLQRMMEVREQLSWEKERSHIAFSKLQDWFRDSVEEANVITLVAIRSDHRVSTYSLLTKSSAQLGHQDTPSCPDRDKHLTSDRRKSRTELEKDSNDRAEEEVLCPKVTRAAAVKLGDRQEERLKKAAVKAEQARAKLAIRKQEWVQLYAEKPDEDYEDPQDVQNIIKARENIGDLKLKSDKDYTVPRHLMMTSGRKRAELKDLEDNMCEKQTELNGRIVALRDTKVRLVSQLRAQAQRLRKVQQRLASHLHRAPPILPTMLPEETPEKRLQSNRATLERYRVLREQRLKDTREDKEEGTTRLLEQLEKEMKEKEEDDQERGEEEEEEEETSVEEEVELTELEEELGREEEIRLLEEQDSLLEQMETSVCQFDAELLQLRHQRIHLDLKLTLADLHQLKLYQELLLLKELETKESSLQEKFDACIREENSIMSDLEECKEQLQLKQRDMVKLQEREKALRSALRASLGDNNKFLEFLTKVFEKKIKRVKKKEPREDDVDSDEESDEDDWDDDDDDDDYDSEEGALDDSVCPPGCDPQMFEYTLQLRERRLDLEEMLAEDKKCVEALKDECSALVKKEKLGKSSRKIVDDDLELVNREKRQRMNELDVVVPLRLHQIEFVVDGSVPSDLSEGLVVDRAELARLGQRIKQLQVEKAHQRDLKVQARHHHSKLLRECKDMKAQGLELEMECNKLMMMKCGRLVNLEVLQTLSGNRVLEELKQQKDRRAAAYEKDLQQWDAKVAEARKASMEVTRRNTRHLLTKKKLLEEKIELESQLNARGKNIQFRQFQGAKRRSILESIDSLQEVVRRQSGQAEALRRDINVLSHKGGPVSPPGHSQLPTPPPSTRTRLSKPQSSTSVS